VSTTRCDDWEDQDGAGERDREAQPAWSRRAVLGAAAGGFALAASGLLLPEWLVEEAEADNHPVRRSQGREERKRQKRHNQHTQHHDRDSRRDDDKPPGRDLDFKDIKFVVGVLGGQPVKVAFYAGAERRTNGDRGPWHLGYELRETKNLAPNTLEWTTFTTGAHENYGALWMQDRFLAHIENPAVGFVQLKMGYGGTFDKDGWHGGTTVFNGNIYEQVQESMTQAEYNFAVYRETDTNDYKAMDVSIGAPNP
jgi:hypothetical protein